MTALSVVEIPVGNLMDIPGMLHRIANNMETGADEVPDKLILIAERVGGKIIVYGLGGYNDTARIIGLLEMAKLKLAFEDND
jgi:hypothetical protein